MTEEEITKAFNFYFIPNNIRKRITSFIQGDKIRDFLEYITTTNRSCLICFEDEERFIECIKEKLPTDKQEEFFIKIKEPQRKKKKEK